MRTLEEIRQAYIEECAIYNRWLAKTKAKYRHFADDVMNWGSHDYETVNDWNDAFRMVERVLGLDKAEVEAIWREVEAEAMKPGKDTPWSYWTEREIAQ